MASRTFGSGASSLLKSAIAAQSRVNSYNDAEQAYIYELSPKSQADYQTYQKYLSDRASKESDPSKALSLQKTQTSAYRTFNSAEIGRASMAVNYGDISKTDKYNQMNGLLTAAVNNGDMNLAQSIESQMSGLSIQIQNDAQTAADNAASAGRAASAAASTATTKQINEFENHIDNAFQTGKQISIGGQVTDLTAPNYALYKAQVLKARYDQLTSEGKDTSSLQKSPDWRGLIDSGLVQFDQNGQPHGAPQLKDNLAITFKKDAYGNTYRDFGSPPVSQSGQPQLGLTQPEPGDNKPGYVTQHALSAEPGASLGRVYTPGLVPATDAQGNTLKINGRNALALNDPLGFSRGQVTGSQQLVDPKTGLRATLYNDKKGGQVTQQQAFGDLQNLANAQPYTPGPADGLLDSINSVTHPLEGALPSALGAAGNWLKGNLEGLSHFNAASTNSGALNTIGRIADIGKIKQAQAQAEAAAAAQRQQALANEYQRQQSNIAALRAASQPRPTIVPTAPKSKLYLPITQSSPAQVFQAATAKNGTSNAGIAKSIGQAVGYNF